MIIDNYGLFKVSWTVLGYATAVAILLYIVVLVVSMRTHGRNSLGYSLISRIAVSIFPLIFLGLILEANLGSNFQIQSTTGSLTEEMINIIIGLLLNGILVYWIFVRIKEVLVLYFLQLNQVSKEVAQGNLNLPDNIINLSNEDVLNQFYAGFKLMVQEIKSLIEEIQSAAIRVASTAEEIASSSSEVSSSSETISSIMENISQGTQAQVQRASDAKSSNENLGNIIKSSFERIQEVLGLTQGISEETNLLALNAAIEAQRAGDAGRGFGIVAKNVRRLADDSRNYTEEIEKVIQEIQDQIVMGQEDISNAIASISDVSQDVASASEEVAASAEEQTATMEELVASTSELSNLASILEARVRKFKFAKSE